jgi:hypothetical protein
MTESSRIPLSAIVKTVGEHFGVPSREILGDSRHASVVMPRQIVYYLAVRLMVHKSTTGIGRELNRDHATLIHGRNKIGKMRQEIPELSVVISNLEEKIRNGKYPDRFASLAAFSQSYMATQQKRSLSEPQVQIMENGSGLGNKACEAEKDSGTI